MRRAMLLCVVAVSMAGCDETRFASDLATTTPTCDRDLSGLYRIEEDHGEATDFLQISAGCHMSLLSRRQARDADPKAPAAQYAKIGFVPNVVVIERKLYLTLSDRSFHELADDSPLTDEDRAKIDHLHESMPGGFHYFRLDANAKRLHVWAVDDIAVAKAIIDGALNGEVHKVENSLNNFVAGETEQQRKQLSNRWLFKSDEPLQMTRIEIEATPVEVRPLLDSK